jgi:hypothetical protein
MARTRADRPQHNAIEIEPRQRHEALLSGPDYLAALDSLRSVTARLRPDPQREAQLLDRPPAVPDPLTRH